MKANLALLSLCLCLATARVQAADATRAAEAWQQSLSAETSQDYAAALKHVLDFKNAGGETYLAAVRAGWLSYLNKDYEKAVQFYTTAAKQEPRAITPHLGLAYTYQAMQKPEDTLRAARNGLMIDQDNVTLLLLAGELLYHQRDYRKAETFFDRAHHAVPENATALSWLGWAQIAQGQAKMAAKHFEKLMQINPDGYLVRDGYAVTHVAGGRGGAPGAP